MPKIKINDRVMVYVLFVVLAVLSTATIVGNRDARIAARNAEVAAEHARAAAIEAKANTVQRDYIISVQKVTGVCTLLTSGAVNTEEIPYETEAILAHHDACIDKYSLPEPPGTDSVSTTTTTTPPSPSSTFSTSNRE